MVAVQQRFAYWDKDKQRHLHSCISSLEKLDFVNSTAAWFTSFKHHADASHLTISSQEAFHTLLCPFLVPNPKFKLDINLVTNGDIQSSRLFIQMLNKTTMKDTMERLRETAEECPVELLVYHTAFIYFDQYAVVTANTIQTVLIAVIVTLVVSLMLIPNPICSIWVAFAISSVVLGVTGFTLLRGGESGQPGHMYWLFCGFFGSYFFLFYVEP